MSNDICLVFSCSSRSRRRSSSVVRLLVGSLLSLASFAGCLEASAIASVEFSGPAVVLQTRGGTDDDGLFVPRVLSTSMIAASC